MAHDASRRSPQRSMYELLVPKDGNGISTVISSIEVKSITSRHGFSSLEKSTLSVVDFMLLAVIVNQCVEPTLDWTSAARQAFLAL